MGRGRRRRRSSPPDNTAKIMAEAQERAREDAARAAEENRKMMAAMQAKADAERKRAEAIARTPAPTKVGSTVGSVEQGLSRKKQYEKRKRAKKASDLRIQLAPAASPMAGGGQGGQPTV
jgi:hypothetical protein